MNSFLAEMSRIFIGSHFDFILLFEIIFRTSFMFLYAILNIRLMDKRSMGMLSPFEIIIIIALGSAIGDPMFYRDIPLIHGMLVISTIVFIERLLTKASILSPKIEKIINGRPELIIHNGVLLEKSMEEQNITRSELKSILRLRGVLDIAEVEYAYLEPSGSVSIIKKDGVSENILPQNGIR